MISSNKDLAAFQKEMLTLHDQNSNFVRCNHEEADIKVFLHAGDIASTSGIPNVLIKTGNTDVLIIAIALFLHIGLGELLIVVGSKVN